MQIRKPLIFLFFVLLFSLLCSPGYAFGFSPNEVGIARASIPQLPEVDIKDKEKFLNDLMLSPCWYVHKDRKGKFTASARATDEDWSTGNTAFLFEFLKNPPKTFPEKLRVTNKYLDGSHRGFTSMRLTIVFAKPGQNTVIVSKSAEKLVLPIYSSFQNSIDANSFSNLAIKLSKTNEIYLVIYEQGADLHRKGTLNTIVPAMEEVRHIAQSPQTYLVRERYEKFFTMLFPQPLQKKHIGRFPGIQDRDTFYGYFMDMDQASYDGINIAVNHPVYCDGECTRKFSRLGKAEYSGKPYKKGDAVFFLIDDNAVYLQGDYDKRFGIFSGKERFKAEMVITNLEGKVLSRSAPTFKGWER